MRGVKVPLLVCITIAWAFSATLIAEETVPLHIELPEPSYMGTPLSYWSEHLEISLKPRDPFMAPGDVTNVALGRPVTSSATPTFGRLNQITDGEKGAAERNVVELPKGLQYIDIDLGDIYEVYAILVWHFHAEERVYFDVIAQLAHDADFIEEVETVYNNDHDNSAGLGIGEDKEYIENHEGKLIDPKGKTARYVRLYSNGNTTDEMNHYIEVEVYGRPAESGPSSPANGKTALKPMQLDTSSIEVE